MIQYILECIIFQLVFLSIYDLLLKGETFFQWNRLYLISTYLLSLVLPWIKIEALSTQLPKEYHVYPAFLMELDQASVVTVASENQGLQLTWLQGVFFGGMFLATILFTYKLYRIYRFRKEGTVHYFPDFTKIIIANTDIAFSFFKSVFLGDRVLEKEHQGIILHEMVHIEQRHTWDLLFFESMRIVGWFNPLVYLYQGRIAELHEFIADAKVAKADKKGQYQLLLSQVFQTQHISFVNQFFKTSLIKKRIVMLQKAKSRKVFQLKYLILAPIVFCMLYYTSCVSELDQSEGIKETFVVGDVANLTLDEESRIFTRLIDLSVQSKNWNLLLKDTSSSIEFSSPNDEASFISGPGGIPIKAKMQIESSILEEDFSLFDAASKNIQIVINENSVPFGVVDEVPIFPGCDNKTDKRACFQDGIQRHISKNFRYPLEAQKQGIEGRVNAIFVITKDGSVQGLKMRGPDKLLEAEVARILSRLPQMTPGKQDGKAVNVPFSIPITFKLQQGSFNGINEDSEYEKVKAAQIAEMPEDLKIEFQNAVPFGEVAQVPILPGCEDASDGRACFMEKMRTHIMKNFNYPTKAKEQGIQGRVNVMFLISKEGEITSIAKRGPHTLLEDEAVRIISRLPKMQPGKKANGQPVNVPFSIPITFKL
ncbi:M56 family metallopeptidase [Flavobacteriaceae bacterium TP-CH-4]|uniref:M56 family metallopeptidase n=1 Tax=Pelagihabitans pacificus TaxID=2696054 RepID=A0A967AXM7_9FLAO|nr:M56 family metallopeptidase [Pelagihabitans pacificus]NHF58466.1 M56 family metallopeptidase [Pelagihabitans pacificus]